MSVLSVAEVASMAVVDEGFEEINLLEGGDPDEIDEGQEIELNFRSDEEAEPPSKPELKPKKVAALLLKIEEALDKKASEQEMTLQRIMLP